MRDKRIADMGERLKAEGMKVVEERVARRKKAIAADDQEAQFRQAAQQQKLAQLKASAANAVDNLALMPSRTKAM